MTLEQEIEYLEGPGFYTRQVAPKDWDYEQYLAALNKMGNMRKALGWKDDYYRESKQEFLESKKRALWNLPEPKPKVSQETLDILAKLASTIEEQNKRLLKSPP